MVGKLIKHEIRRTLRWYLIAIGCAALVGGLSSLAAGLLPAPLNGLFSVTAVVAAVAVPSAMPLLLGVDFYRSSYSKTGYLTRAIPVRGTTIYWVKLLYAYALSLLSLAVGLALGYMAAISLAVVAGGSVDDVNASISSTFEAMGELLPGWAAALLVVAVLLWPFTWLASYYLAATVGSQSWSGRMGIGGPIVVWVLFYVASQVAGLLGAFIPVHLQLGEDGFGVRTGVINIFTIEDSAIVPLGIFIMMFLLAVLAIGWGAVSFDKKAELR